MISGETTVELTTRLDDAAFNVTLPAALAAAGPVRQVDSVDEYHRMIQVGIFQPDERLEFAS